MDPDYQKFGRGPRERTGAVDLISHYKLLPHHNFFCKKPLHVSISDSHYLHNVVGDTEVRKGEGMQLSQLILDSSLSRDINKHIQPFDLDILKEAFQPKETAPVNLPPSEKGTTSIPGKSKSKSKDKEKDKEHKKHKHRHKDRSKDKGKKKDKSGLQDSVNDRSKRHHKKKRKREGDEQTNSKSALINTGKSSTPTQRLMTWE